MIKNATGYSFQHQKYNFKGEKVMGIAILLIALVVGYIVANKLIIKYFQNVYSKTGQNPFSFVYQLFSALIFTPMLLNLANPEFIPVPVLVVIGVACAAILVVMNLKLKDVKTIVFCSICQIIFGLFFLVRAFLGILILLWNVVANVTGNFPHIRYNPMKIVVDNGGNLKEQRIETDAVPEEEGNGDAFMGYDVAGADAQRKAEAAAFAEAEKERNNEAAEAYAQSYGFDSKQDAEDHGFM